MEKIKLYGVDVYTSEELQEKFKKFINKHGPPVTKEILISLVDENIIVPVINEPSKLKQLIMKIRKKKPVRVLGVANMKTGKAYVIFHETLSPKRIMEVAFHEAVHLAFHQSPKEFTAINMPLYIRFYTYFYKELFEANGYDKEKFAEFLKRLTRVPPRIRTSTYRKILASAFKDYTRLPEERFKIRIKLILGVMRSHIIEKKRVGEYHVVLATIRKTYRQLFKNMDYQAGVIQELWSSSEIIAILSTINPNHSNVIKSLKLIKPGKKPVIKDLARKIVK